MIYAAIAILVVLGLTSWALITEEPRRRKRLAKEERSKLPVAPKRFYQNNQL